MHPDAMCYLLSDESCSSNRPPMNQDIAAVLVVETDCALAGALANFLTAKGYVVMICSSARAGRELLDSRCFHALILAARLPDGDSFTLCRHLRRLSNAAILMLTATNEVLDRIVGLESGADDCIEAPVVLDELLARLKATMRRRRTMMVSHEPLLTFGSLEIDRRRRSVRLDGAEKSLSSHLFALLLVFAENAGRALRRDELLELLRERSLANFGRSIDVQVCRLRALIESDAHDPRRLITIRGTGYLFEPGAAEKP